MEEGLELMFVVFCVGAVVVGVEVAAVVVG